MVCRWYGVPFDVAERLPLWRIREAVHYGTRILAIENEQMLRVNRITAGRMYDDDIVRTDAQAMLDAIRGTPAPAPDHEANWSRFRERMKRGA